jgi:hypothetical protein
MHTNRVPSAALPASVAAQSLFAGTIASSNGSPIAVPIPRSIVRLEMCFPVMNSIVKTSLEELRVT